MGRQLAWLILLAGLAGACALFEGPRASREERLAYADALTSLPDNPAAAERSLREFVARWPRSPLADDAAFRLAELARARGDEAEARRWLEVVVREHPAGDESDAARLRLAAFETERGNTEAAARLLEQLRFSRLDRSGRREALRLLVDTAPEAVTQLRWLARLREQWRDEKAVARIDREIDDSIRQLGAGGHARAAEQIGRRIPAARILVAEAERALEADDLLAARRALERASELPLAPRYAPRLTSALERLALREQRPREVSELPTLAELADRSPPSTAGARGTIGVLLPLSGSFGHLGEDSLHGVLLAAEIFEAQAPAPGPDEGAPERWSGEGPGGEESDGEGPNRGELDGGGGWFDEIEAEPSGDVLPGVGAAPPAARTAVRVLVRDTAGRPERAAQAVRELARHQDLVAIVGPLVSAECEAAAEEAEALAVPLLTLTAREQIARDRPHVFRLRTRPSEEVAVLLDHAMSVLGAQRFAILYPRDAYGRRLRSLFWDAVEERGGEIVGVAGYDRDATDFADPIRRLVGYVLLTQEEEAALEERKEMLRQARRLPTEEARALREEARALTGPEGEPLPPIVDFDALFIPDSHDKIVLIAPQLAFHEAIGMKLLGPSGWAHSDLVRIGRDHVKEAVFAAHFFPGSRLSVVRQFARRYRETFGTSPDVFAAQAFDAANLVLAQLARGRETREEVRRGVLSVRAYPGVSGVLSMRADGNARKRPFLLGVKRGRIIELDALD